MIMASADPQASTNKHNDAPRSLPRIRMETITKRYGPVVALDGVDFELSGPEIVGLVGENGAGKSTLMSILYGLTRADSGRLVIDEQCVPFFSPREAIAKGIGMIPQRANLVPTLSIAENIALGSSPAFSLAFQRSQLERSVGDVADQYSLEVDPSRIAAGLPADVRQRVAILRLLYRNVKTLILDEPTATLGDRDIEELLAILLRLKDSGHRCVVITHKLSEIVHVADKVVVLRRGQAVKTVEGSAIDEPTLIEAMFGGEPVGVVDRGSTPTEGPVTGVTFPSQGTGIARNTENKEFFRVSDIRIPTEKGAAPIGPISFDVARGEVFAFIGVEGNGETELIEVLCGLRRISFGTISLKDIRIDHLGPRDRLLRHNVAVVTGEPTVWDLAADLTVTENLALRRIAGGDPEFVRRGILRLESISRFAERLVVQYGIKPKTAASLKAGALSGGNQQRVVLARELSGMPEVLIAARPTLGLDAEASRFVREQIRRLATRGSAVVYFTGDFDEAQEVGDTIAVLFRGRINYVAQLAAATRAEVANALAGMSTS